MLVLLTGVPGSGKTLYAVSDLAKQFKDRPIFYYGIPELKLDWIPLADPTKWETEIPANGVLVIDEAQKIFPVRPSTQRPPPHIENLTTHRHMGIDVVLLTQHPMLLDAFIRRVCGRHMHFHRAIGLEAATIFEWDNYDEAFNTRSRQEVSVRTRWSFPKSSYGLYKSAEVHTHKRRIPRFFYYVPIGLIVCALAASLYVKSLADLGAPPDPAKSAFNRLMPTSTGASSPTQLTQLNPHDPMASLVGFSSSSSPPISQAAEPYQPWHHPKYAALIEPKRAPTPAGCISRRTTDTLVCTCYTEDATIIEGTTHDFCAAYMRNAVFSDWRDSIDSRSSGSESRSSSGKSGRGSELTRSIDRQSSRGPNPPFPVDSSSKPSQGVQNPREAISIPDIPLSRHISQSGASYDAGFNTLLTPKTSR
jgi:zona occludens toxin